MKRVIVRYTDGGQDEAWLQPYDDMCTNRELAKPAYRDPDTGECWVTDAEQLACHAFFALKRAGRVAEDRFTDWYQRVEEVEPRYSHKDVDELMAVGGLDRKLGEFMHKRVDELGDGRGESPAPPSR